MTGRKCAWDYKGNQSNLLPLFHIIDAIPVFLEVDPSSSLMMFKNTPTIIPPNWYIVKIH
jgi:hypothetical protein